MTLDEIGKLALDEIGKLAREANDNHKKRIADIYECGRMEAIRTLEQLAADSTNDATDLARAVLAMLPVVRAAEALHDVAPDGDRIHFSHGLDNDLYGATEALDGLIRSIDTMRKESGT